MAVAIGQFSYRHCRIVSVLPGLMDSLLHPQSSPVSSKSTCKCLQNGKSQRKTHEARVVRTNILTYTNHKTELMLQLVSFFVLKFQELAPTSHLSSHWLMML